MKRVIYHYGPTASGKTFELQFNFSKDCLGIWWMRDMSKKALRRGIRGYSRDHFDTICFDNLYASRVEGLHLPAAEFLKLTDPEAQRWRGFRTTSWDTIRFTSFYWPDDVWEELNPALIWSRIDQVVYHYLHKDGSWYYMIFNTYNEPLDVEDLRFLILQKDPDAVFSCDEVDTLRNYAYGRKRLTELGYDFKVSEDGRFYFDEPMPTFERLELVFDEWDNNLMVSMYDAKTEMLIEVDSRNETNTIFLNVSDDERRAFENACQSYETYDDQMARMKESHEFKELPMVTSPAEHFDAIDSVIDEGV